MSTKEINGNEIYTSEIKEAASLAIKELTKRLDPPKPSKSSIIKSLKQYYSMTFNKNDSILSTPNDIEEGNILTDFLPGYKAPMKLKAYHETEKVFTKNGYLSITLQKHTDRSYNSQQKEHIQTVQELMEHLKQPTSSFKNPKKSKREDSMADEKWFNIEQNKTQEELDDDLKVLQMRDVIDPKRFYKSYNQEKTVRQVGTVIEGSNEYYSNRLTKKERRLNITEEFMSDVGVSSYTKDKFEKIQMAERSKRLPTKKVRRNKHVYKRY